MDAGAVTYANRSYEATSSCSAYTNNVNGTDETFSCCTKDGCNGCATLSSSLSLAFALIAAVGVLKTFMVK